LYFDLEDELRIGYSKLWLSLIAGASPKTLVDRRKYAESVGNITVDLVSLLISFVVFVQTSSSIRFSRQLSQV